MQGEGRVTAPIRTGPNGAKSARMRTGPNGAKKKRGVDKNGSIYNSWNSSILDRKY